MTRGLVLLLMLATPAGADPFVDRVVSYTIATGGGAGEDRLPGIVLGPPRGGGPFEGSTDTFSLGLGGSIVLEFTDNMVVDGPGVDFTVFENPFIVRGSTTEPPYAEPGVVSVSADGVHWATFPCALDQPPYYPGCAGVYPVFANANDPAGPSPLVPSTTPIEDLVGVPVDSFTPPPGSGGDSFDLAAVGLHAIRFVRIDGGPIDLRLGGLSGFDLDAIAAVHSVDTPDNCPDVPNPDQADTDGDGAGDACDPCPDDPTCLPPRPPGAGCAGHGGAADSLITCIEPRKATTALPAGARTATLVLVIAPDVEPASVRVRVGARDFTASAGALVPGSTKILTVPLARHRTVVRLKAKGPRTGRRRLVDVDRLVFLVDGRERSVR